MCDRVAKYSDWLVKLIDMQPEDYPQDPQMGGYHPMPRQQRFGSHNCGYLRQGSPTQFLGFCSKPTPLIVRKSKSVDLKIQP